MVVSGQNNNDLFSSLGILVVSGQKNKELSSPGGFWAFQAKRITICPLVRYYGSIRVKE